MPPRSRKPKPGLPPASINQNYPMDTDSSQDLVAESTLTSKGQVTIPQIIRTKYQLDAGDSLVWRQDGDGRLFVEAKRALTLRDIRAAIAAAGAPVPSRAFTLAEMKEAIGESLGAKYGRP